ncbi:MAG: hypothetical protein JKY37_21795, partial [Nannocystaceae bacterium]|nr:hypothetical protein [Nannocystaceae bacterium]
MRRALTFVLICATSCTTEPIGENPDTANSGEPESPSIESSVANVRRLPLATAEVGSTKIAVELVADATYHFPFILHPLGGTTVASTRNRIARLTENGTDLQWSSADISNELPPGQYGGIEVELIGGTWPTHVVGVLADTRPRMKSVRRYVRWSADAWQPWQAAPAAGGVYLAFTAWGDKGLLGLQHVDRWSGRSKTFDPSIDVFPKGRGPQVPRGYIPVTLTASATGHVYAIASELDDHRARLITWGPDGGAALQVLDLPEVAGLTPRAGDVRVVEDRGVSG